ncbi:CaiB/BaiF CoA transferase family protein [Amycolatopsis jejuensis]|uniref:CaiB/BaiF CoA transferase family protein n=1 Tax=Amycolatopsis jejuensis TaxID=330084 RepID=UPI00052460B1|nr:CoA transferase [Amycolatopsis jejuensis]
MLPLAGVRVVEFASNVAGPYAGLVLQDLGAEVLKVERPGSGDVVRGWPPFSRTQVSAPFTAINRGKKSIVLDLKSGQGRELLHTLLADADVFISSLRPGKAADLSVDATTLRSTHPRLVVSEISGYGPRGPLGGEPGYDAILQAFSGIMDVTGHPDGPPARVGTAMLDFGTGMWAAMGAVAALFQRSDSGTGASVQASLLGTASGFLMHHIASVTMADVHPARIGTAQHNSAPYEALTAADGQVMVGVTSVELWRSLCSALGRTDLIDDPRFATNETRVANRGELVTALNDALTGRDAESVVKDLKSAGVPASVIRTVGDLAHDEQAIEAGYLQKTADGSRLATSPVIIDDRLAELDTQRAPHLGEHTEEILRMIGKRPDEIGELRSNGIIA